MKRLTFFALILLLLLLVACDGGQRQRMEALLDRADSLNRAYVPMTGGLDTLLGEATRYYDRYGTANEQMRAYYLLGCAYRDMGEAPRALDLYHKAAECADTTATDCNFALLARVHGQMAALFEDYALPRNQLDEERAAYRYAMMGHDTVAALAFLNKQASCYSQLGIDDSVIYYCEEACRRYLEIGDTLRAHTALEPATYAYLERKNYLKAKEYLDKQEYQSTLTGNEPFLEKNQYQLYYHKGVYYAAMHQYDSASIAYRKLIRNGVTPNNVSLGYYGLYSLYSQMGITDSIVKYADQYTYHNGIFVRRLEHSKLQAAQSLYNYTRHQQVAERESARSEHLTDLLRLWFIIAVSVVLLLLLIVYILRSRIKSRIRRIANNYSIDVLSYQKLSLELREVREKEGAASLRIKQLEEELGILRKSIVKQLGKESYSDDLDVEQMLLNSSIVETLHRKAAKGEVATFSDWNELRKACSQFMPGFMDAIGSFDYQPNLLETNICLLVKLRFVPAEQCVLLNTKQTTHLRARLYEKWYHKKVSVSKFDDFILSIPV